MCENNSMNNTDVFEQINEYLANRVGAIAFPGLLDGNAGLSLYHYLLYRYTNDETYKQRADSLIDQVCDTSHVLIQNDRLSFERGLSGVSWVIMFLAQHCYIDSEIDETIREIDDYIFKRLANKSTEELSKISMLLLGILVYLTCSIRFNRSRDREATALKISLARDLVNFIDKQHVDDGYAQITKEPTIFSLTDYRLPLYLYIIAELYQANIYTEKLDRIIEGMIPIIQRSFPALYSNRIYLLVALYHLTHVKCVPAWDAHIKALEQNIDFERMFQREFRDRSVNFKHGLSGLLFILRITSPTNRIPRKEELCKQIAQKIEHSTFFHDLASEKTEPGIMLGICGIGLSLLLNRMGDKSIDMNLKPEFRK